MFSFPMLGTISYTYKSAEVI